MVRSWLCFEARKVTEFVDKLDVGYEESEESKIMLKF